jgi:hypothetical protein
LASPLFQSFEAFLIATTWKQASQLSHTTSPTTSKTYCFPIPPRNPITGLYVQLYSHLIGFGGLKQ